MGFFLCRRGTDIFFIKRRDIYCIKKGPEKPAL
jgi:hypothetical protein